MTKTEYKDYLKCELYRGKDLSLISKIRIKYFQPNTNCVYLARKMWYLYSKRKISKMRAKFLYLKIIHRYGCVIYPSANVGKGFHITHPVGIVIGDCNIGDNFMIYQNCSVGTRHYKDAPPHIGNKVMLCSNSLILGNVKVSDGVTIGASSLVINDINEPGVYAGNPLVKLKG